MIRTIANCTLLLHVMFVFHNVAGAQSRKWTDSSGKFSVEAVFEAIENDVLILRKSDGSVVRVPLSRLSETDRNVATQIATAAPQNNPFTSGSPSSADGKVADSGQKVVAEGTGSSADEALKDAFRNAVRQVVGAVVDAETMIKNDQVIDDKVLTYSGGFVKSYTTVPGSEKTQGGVHRIRISATVERRDVVAKLKLANISIKDIDGKSMFAEVVTKADVEQNAAALITKAFDGFPVNCLIAEISGKPEISKKEAGGTVKVRIKLSVDLPRYRTFSQEFVKLLENVCRDKGEFSATFKPVKNTEGLVAGLIPAEPPIGDPIIFRWMPKAGIRKNANQRTPFLNTEQAVIAVGINRTAAADRIDYRYYVLDKVLQSKLIEISNRVAEAKLTLVNESGDTIATDRFKELNPLDTRPQRFSNRTLMVPIGKDGAGGMNIRVFDYSDSPHSRESVVFIVSPTFVRDNNNWIIHEPDRTVFRTVDLSLEELKAVANIRCELSTAN